MLNERDRKGFLLVLSSPSGGGKSTIYNALLEMGEPFGFSVSSTTRPPRPGEIDGVHYHFISDEAFKRKIAEGEFAEWADVHEHKYGTLKKFVEKALAENKIMIFEIDVQGAVQLREAYPEDTVLVFIAAPSAGESERRLRSRGTDSEEDIRIRLRNSREEINRYMEYDYFVINDRLEDAIGDVISIVRAELLASDRFIGEIWPD